MSQRSQRVWTIATPKVMKWRARSPSPAPRPMPPVPMYEGSRRGHSTLAAYLLGPLASRIWGGSSLSGWAVADLCALVFGIALVVEWAPFTRWLDHVPYGLSIWLVVVPTLMLAVASAWARSIASARPPSSRPGSWLSRWGKDPRVVGLLGLLVPGLGLMIVRCRRHAAASFWLMGPLVASAIVLANRGWLWEKSRSLVTPGVRGTTLEIVFAAAAVVGALALLGWIVQALDGARRVSEARGPSDAAAMGLVVAVMLFAVTYHPSSWGRQLCATAADLQADGFRVIPLALYETAARLDPATPTYLVEAAALADALGLAATAQEHRALLARRAMQWSVAASLERPAEAPAPRPPPRPVFGEARTVW